MLKILNIDIKNISICIFQKQISVKFILLESIGLQDCRERLNQGAVIVDYFHTNEWMEDTFEVYSQPVLQLDDSNCD